MIDEDVRKTILNDIYNVIYKIKNCKSKSMYDIYLYDLDALYYLCYQVELKDYPKLEDYSYKSYKINENKLIRKYKNQLLEDKKYHLSFSENGKSIDREKLKNGYNFVIDDSIKTEEIVKIMIDFLKEYDMDLYNIFIKLYNENRIIIINKEFDSCNDAIASAACMISSYATFMPYILINSAVDLDDSINIIHELGHVYDYIQVRSSKVNMQKKMNCLDEVIAYYLQFVYIDYFNKKKKINKIDNLYYGYTATYIQYIDKIKEEYERLDRINLYNSYIDEYFSYTYGIVIAYHFLERYKLDPEKTKREIKNFVMLNGQYNMMEMLEIFNLKEEILDSKILKKYL